MGICHPGLRREAQDRLRKRGIPMMKQLNSLNHGDSSRLVARRMTPYPIVIPSELCERGIPMMKQLNSLNHGDSSRLVARRMTQSLMVFWGVFQDIQCGSYGWFNV
jgi:hypothetical protein